MADTAARFHALAEDAVEDLLRLDPEWATDLGDHRFDDQLTDMSEDGLAGAAATLADHRDELDSLDAAELEPADAVDAQILRSGLDRRLFGLQQLREHTWNPLPWLPGEAIYLLLSRDTGPVEDRLRALGGRLEAVPERLATARATLRDMPRVHVETALTQISGLISMLREQIPPLAGTAPRTFLSVGADADRGRGRAGRAPGLAARAARRRARRPAPRAEPVRGQAAPVPRRGPARRPGRRGRPGAPGPGQRRAHRARRRLGRPGRRRGPPGAGPGRGRGAGRPHHRVGGQALADRGDRAGHQQRRGPGAGRPDGDRGDAGAAARRRGGLLRRARAAGGAAVPPASRSARRRPAGRRSGSPRSTASTTPHDGQPHRARGDAGAHGPARPRPPLPRCDQGQAGTRQRLVHRGLGGARGGDHGQARVRRRAGPAAAAEEQAAYDDQRACSTPACTRAG